VTAFAGEYVGFERHDLAAYEHADPLPDLALLVGQGQIHGPEPRSSAER
jgi:hypothetical protein